MATTKDRLRPAREDDTLYGSPPPVRNGSGYGSLILALVVVIALAGLAVAIWAAVDDDGSAGPEIGVTLDDISADPGAFIGRTVVVSGTVGEFVGGAPEIGDGVSGFMLGGDLLVMAPNAEAMTGRLLSRGDDLRVRGVLHSFDAATLEDEFDLDLNDLVWDPFRDQPVLVATDMRIIDPVDAEGGTPSRITATEIVGDPGQFVGQRVTVESIVTDVLGPHAFAIEEGELLVIGETTTDVDVGDVAEVQGVVHEFDLEPIDNETGFGLDPGLFEDWDGRPTIVATDVTPLGR